MIIQLFYSHTQGSDITPRQLPLPNAVTTLSTGGDGDSDDFDSQESIQSMEDDDNEEEDDKVSSLSSDTSPISSSLEAAEELEARLAALEHQFLADTLALAAIIESRLVEERLAGRAETRESHPAPTLGTTGSMACVNSAELATPALPVGTEFGRTLSQPASGRPMQQQPEQEKQLGPMSPGSRQEKLPECRYLLGAESKEQTPAASIIPDRDLRKEVGTVCTNNTCTGTC